MTVLEQKPLTVSVPLWEDPPGVFRVGKSRVLLELVIRAYQRGSTPQDIREMYRTLDLRDIFAVIAYYLAAPTEIDEYLRKCDEEADATRRTIEASQPAGATKDELLARKGERAQPVIRLLADQNFNGYIVAGLMQRDSVLDLVHVRDVGLAAASDPAILEWAAAQDRILLSHDYRTIPRFAYARVAAAQPMPGVFLVSDAMPTAQAIDEILLAVQCLSTEECKDIVKYFPM